MSTATLQTTAPAPTAAIEAVRYLAAAEDVPAAVPVPPAAGAPAGAAAVSAVTAMVAAARAKVALAGPAGWDTILETRNMLVDFINAEALRTAGGDVSHLKPAEDAADALELLLQGSDCPARVQLALTLRLHVEGFEVSGFVPGLVEQITADPEPPPAAPKFDDADAVARWDAVQDAFLTAQTESERASNIEGEQHDSVDLRVFYDLHEPIHRGWRICRDVMLATPAPHWAALSLKATTLIQYADTSRWTKAAKDFSDAADEIGTVRPADADLISVMRARGHAEQIAFFAAHRADGYANYACGLGQVAPMAAQIDALVMESRDLARVDKRHAMMSGEIIGAVWFSKVRGTGTGGEVEALDEEFSTVIRTQHRLDGRKDLTEAEKAELQKAEDRLDEIQEAACGFVPVTRSGVAFQLIVAASLIDRVYGGATDAMREKSGEQIRAALANAVRVMGLPFDYRAATYFMGPQLSDLDGRDLGGPRVADFQ